jgi:hypothetical protein
MRAGVINRILKKRLRVRRLRTLVPAARLKTDAARGN